MAEPSSKQSHPQGLYPLFFTEMWERFGYYLLIGILFLYMTDGKDGLGLDGKSANDIYGTYIALVYLTPFLGGLLADRIFGYRKTIIAGGLLMAAGYFTLSIPGFEAFCFALLLVILGNGLFKPNISTLLGNLYNTPEHSPLKDKGYNIFYMGINIGAFACNFVAAYLRNKYGWGAAFASAGIGMMIGLVTFILLQSRVARADVIKPAKPEDMPLGKICSIIFVPAFIFAVIGYFSSTVLGNPVFGSKTADAFLFACIPVVCYYASLFFRASSEDRGSIGSLLYIFIVVIIFWAVFHQNGNVLTAWAEKHTWREVPESMVSGFEKVGFAEKVSSVPGVVVQDGNESNSPYVIKFSGKKKDAAEEIASALGPNAKVEKTDSKAEDTAAVFSAVMAIESEAAGTAMIGKLLEDGKLSFEESKLNSYLQILPKEQWPKEDATLGLVNTELFQSLNPFFVVILTPVVVAFFTFLAGRGKEPSTATKIALGLAITALSTLVMIAAVYASGNGQTKVSPMWLVTTYAVITIGELCLSPMGLSLVSKLSPPRLTALMMGGWFLSTSIGNKLAGVLGHFGEDSPNKALVFWINFGGAAVSSLLLFVMVRKIDAIMRAKTGGK
jgi:POT family proton-dependent oligopeptide transporter